MISLGKFPQVPGKLSRRNGMKNFINPYGIKIHGFIFREYMEWIPGKWNRESSVKTHIFSLKFPLKSYYFPGKCPHVPGKQNHKSFRIIPSFFGNNVHDFQEISADKTHRFHRNPHKILMVSRENPINSRRIFS